MAQVPVDALPSVAPSAAPTPRQDLNPPAAAFGGNVGGAILDAGGKAAQSIGTDLNTYALQFQAINNKQAADFKFQQYTQAQDKAVADFKANNAGIDPATGQAAAYQNMGGLYKSLEGLRNATGEGLSPLAQVEYEQQTRRYLQNAQSDVTNFAVSQRKESLVSTQLSLIKSAQDDAAANVDDPDRVNSDIARIAEAHATLSLPQYNGTPEETSRELLKQDVGAIFAGAIKQKLDGGDIPSAQALYSQHKDSMTFEQSTAVAGALKTGAKDFVVQSVAQGVMAGQPVQDFRVGVGPALSAGGLVGAIFGQESGNNPNIHDSSAGAKGIGQITPVFWQTFAKPGEDINNPHDNATVAARGINTYEQEFHDPARVAVAYFSGPGNVAPAGSATPWKRDAVDSDGTHTSTYVQQVLGRLGGPTATGHVAPVVAPAPPPIAPNEDPAQIKSDYDTYLQTWVPKVYGDDPALAQRVMEASRNAMAVRVQGVQTAQTASTNRLVQALTDAATAGHPITDIGGLKTAYTGAPADLAVLPPAAHDFLQSKINLASAGYGAYKSPEMTANAESLAGMNSSQFMATDLSKLALSAPDYVHFAGEQQRLQRSAQAASERDAKLQSYLSDPLVQTAVNKMWPTDAQRADPSKGYTNFLGALDTRVQELKGIDGKPPTQDQVRTAAQQLLLAPQTWNGVGMAQRSAAPAPTATGPGGQKMYWNGAAWVMGVPH